VRPKGLGKLKKPLSGQNVHEHDSIFICSPTCTVFPQNIGRGKSIKSMKNVLSGNVCGKGVARMIYWAYLKYCGFL
jgi:hypothetical protein